MKIGVFDSGIGGQSVAQAIKNALPDLEVIFVNDQANLPYGTKTPEQLKKLVLPILQNLVAQDCQVIVVACNTVTTTLIKDLRAELPVPLIGVEPMVKPATERTKSRVIAVCATPTTLASERYKWLKNTYAQGVKVLEPDCSGWALMVETDNIDHTKIKKLIKNVIRQGADVVVLGCTHYHWIQDEIKTATQGRATVIQPEAAIVKRLKTELLNLAP